ncbi:c-type cytochrome domain-containing protein [Rhodopirellula sp. MGV]|uniref:c-type cytochrome domain-containing protein n=1 Tax=Rhodopirellula sp. MGV TaxID=2023130 RepID=UPI0013044535|nr:c-type cytochrome domain-containing protein [Rhodopirellula sp. MGV]
MTMHSMNRLASQIRSGAAVWVVVVMFTAGVGGAAELDRRQQTLVRNLGIAINSANKNYFDQKIESAENDYRRAQEQVERIVAQDNPDLFDAITKHLDAMRLTHAKLELEGASLPPFRRPERPTGTGAGMKPGDSATDLVSFQDDVAPILSTKCGSCHVTRSQGGFSLASYAVLMKGPPEGVVVFAGDVIGSRLIETIETGDMPRGGATVSPDELKTLKDWVLQGAKFDGADATARIGAGGTPDPAPQQMTPVITKATGDESISFSADIAPLLVDNCSGCHLDAMQTRGGLQMNQFTQLMRGGDSGPVITPGRGEASLIVKKLRGTAADGARMPVGRPALSDDSIALISRWIDEGAKLDADEALPVKVMARMAWVASASSEEITARRTELANQNLKLAGSSQPLTETQTDHFRVVGPGSKATQEMVAKAAEGHLKIAKTVAKSAGKTKADASAEGYFQGKATIFVFPKRYDYSEFAKMVEQRSVPADWNSHWSYDGEDAYLVTVASESDDEEAIEDRLLAPVISLAVASRGMDVPRWFSEGIGSALASEQTVKNRLDKAKLRTKMMEAASTVKDAKAFLENRLTPEQADALGTLIAMTMLDRARRKSLDTTIRYLSAGKPFEQAFAGGFGVSPAVYLDQFLSYSR